jgi:hypothetical protein
LFLHSYAALIIKTFYKKHRNNRNNSLPGKNEDLKLRVIEEKHIQDMKAMRKEMNQQFNQIMSLIHASLVVWSNLARALGIPGNSAAAL